MTKADNRFISVLGATRVPCSGVSVRMRIEEYSPSLQSSLWA